MCRRAFQKLMEKTIENEANFGTNNLEVKIHQETSKSLWEFSIMEWLPGFQKYFELRKTNLPIPFSNERFEVHV